MTTGGGRGEISFADSEFKGRKYNSRTRIRFKPNSVFVIMSFNGTKELLTVIKDECSKLGLEATRVDENAGSGFVARKIYESIQSAEFIVCDLTKERPNVYYELGYAHGVGNHESNILLVAKKGTNLHFNIAPLQIQHYSSIAELRSIISHNLQEMIKQTRKRSRGKLIKNQ